MKGSHHTEGNAAQSASLAPYANLLGFSFFNATTWVVSLGTPLVLLAGQLGASSFEVGLAYSFVFMLLPVQILATVAIPRFGYKRQAMFGWGTRGIFLLVPLWLAWLAPAEPQRWMVLALIGSAFGFSLCRSLGSCAIMPLVYAILPDHIRGRYFSVDQAVIGVSAILTLLFCSALFKAMPVYDAFFWQYLYAIAGVFLTVYFLAKWADPPKPQETSLREILHETPQVCLRKSPYRQYLVFMIAASLMGPAYTPLTAYYLKTEAGFGVDQILLFTAIHYAGVIIGTLVMRNQVDAIGVKPVFRLSLLLNAAISAFWFFFISGTSGLGKALPVAYFLFGLAASQWVTANLKYLPRVCDDARQALHVSVHGAVIGVIGGIAPIAWGFLVKLPGTLPGVQDDRFALYFVALLLVQLGLLFYVPRLTSENAERPAIQDSDSVLRPARYLGNLINAIPEDKRGQPLDFDIKTKSKG